jgi:hypothetical protein
MVTRKAKERQKINSYAGPKLIIAGKDTIWEYSSVGDKADEMG